MAGETDKYFRFVRFSLGLDEGKEILSNGIFQESDWNGFFRFAKKQALIGIAFDGMQRLPKELAPPKAMLMNWLMLSQTIRKQNIRANHATAYIYNKICWAGFRCCILKGQGNALMYPNSYSRTPGDVDVWVNASRKDIRRLAQMLAAEGNGRIGEESRNHIEMTINGFSVELHSTPAIMNNPWHDHRMQRWLQRNAELQCSNLKSLPDGTGSVAVPTNTFNVIYQLFHLFHHYLYEGVGLRQFVDYYFVLKGLNIDKTALTALQQELKKLGLWNFAGAVMYVLREFMGMSEERMIVPMDKKRGNLLLAEIMRGGNFGHYAEKNHSGPMMWRHNIYRLQKDLKLMKYYPSECLAEPFYRIWHFLWRKGFSIVKQNRCRTKNERQ